MSKTLVKNLRAVRKLLSTEARWTKDVLARDKLGREVESDAPAACRWCLSGAVERVVKRQSEQHEALDAIRDALPASFAGEDVENFNDANATTHSRTLAVIDRAIRAAAK